MGQHRIVNDYIAGAVGGNVLLLLLWLFWYFMHYFITVILSKLNNSHSHKKGALLKPGEHYLCGLALE